jgi:hypothetical protein
MRRNRVDVRGKNTNAEHEHTERNVERVSRLLEMTRQSYQLL